MFSIYHTTMCRCVYIHANITTCFMTQSQCPVFLVFCKFINFNFEYSNVGHIVNRLFLWFGGIACRPPPPPPPFSHPCRECYLAVGTHVPQYIRILGPNCPQRFMYVETCVHETFTCLDPHAQSCRMISLSYFQSTISLIRIN
jgi:hypothetical protein